MWYICCWNQNRIIVFRATCQSRAQQIYHVSVTEHFIRKPISEKEFSAIKNFVTISCINNPNVEQLERGRAYISYCEKFELGKMALDSAKKIFNDQTPDEINKISKN